MRIIFIAIFLHLSTFNSYAEKKISCISGPAAYDILKDISPDNSVDRGDVKFAYAKLLKSEILVYDTPRPYLYSANLSFTRFAKRICHDQICDPGDLLGTLHKCHDATSESCVIIAATKGKDLYCFLNPVNWDISKPYDPFDEKR